MSAEEKKQELRAVYERLEAELEELKKQQKKKLKLELLVMIGLFLLTLGIYLGIKNGGKTGADTLRHIRNACIAVNGGSIAWGFNILKLRVFNMAHFDTQKQRNKLNFVLQCDLLDEGKDLSDYQPLTIETRTLEELDKAGKLG